MLDDDWEQTAYPFVPGYEVVGRIVALGGKTKGLEVGQRVGLGWYSESCMACPQCLSGSHNLCARAERTIVKRHGGFADRVHCHWAWAVPLPETLSSQSSGPLLCAGITVFNPILQCNVLPTDRVGVIGIGGLLHIALQFLTKWGCEVTAFTSSDSKRNEALKFGVRHVVNSRDANQLKGISGSLDFGLLHGQRITAVGCHYRQSRAARATAYCGRGIRADSGRSVFIDWRREIHFLIAGRQSIQRRTNAEFLRSPSNQSDD